MAEQFDALNEKTKLIDIAMKFTYGDMNKAKEMVAGQYLDVIAVKGRFHVDKKGYSGAFIAFFNFIHEYISNITSIISSKSALYEKTRVFDDWKLMYRDILKEKEGPDMLDSQNFNYFLMDSFIGYDVFPDVKEQKLDDLTSTVTEIISKSFNIPSIKCQIEFEPTSSLAITVAGISIDVPGMEKKEAEVTAEENDETAKIESEAKYVIEGRAVLSPVRGTNVSELKPGDKIKVILPGTDMVSEKIIKLLNAYDDESQRVPVTGRLKAKVPDNKNGYILYAFVAKGVLAKIIEEENVKVLLDKPFDETLVMNKSFDNKLIYIMSIVVGLIILCGIILIVIL